MKKWSVVLAMLLFMMGAISAHAITAWYQPTPYPSKQADGTAMPQDIGVVRVWDGWLPSYYYGQSFQRDSSLLVGGWGDQYWTFMKFDLTGLPQSADQALVYLMPYSASGSPTPYAVCSVTSSWDLSMTWNTQPSLGTCYGYYAAPTAGAWSGVWLSGGGPDWYNQWRSGALANNGVMLFPQTNNNNFDAFYSTLYNNYQSDPYADARRPALQLTFTPTLQLKMPLAGSSQGLSWLATTEVGGYDCLGHATDGSNDPWPDPYHQGANYFSLDFSWKNKNASGTQAYAATDNIPVLAAAGGTTTTVLNDPYNGNYVVVTHGSTGFTTRYLHLSSIAVANNVNVAQGAVLGYMGNEGQSNGKHLHFGVRYNGSGASTVPELTKVVMEGRLLKSYQTECSADPSTGIPAAKIRYYPSSNY